MRLKQILSLTVLCAMLFTYGRLAGPADKDTGTRMLELEKYLLRKAIKEDVHK